MQMSWVPIKQIMLVGENVARRSSKWKIYTALFSGGKWKVKWENWMGTGNAGRERAKRFCGAACFQRNCFSWHNNHNNNCNNVTLNISFFRRMLLVLITTSCSNSCYSVAFFSVYIENHVWMHLHFLIWIFVIFHFVHRILSWWRKKIAFRLGLKNLLKTN